MLKKETLDALNDAKKNLSNAISHHRTDIVISLLKEWFKKVETSENNELIERKCFFNEPYCENNTKTPLQVAFNLKNRDIVRALLTCGADPSIKDPQTNKTFYQIVQESNDSNMKQVFTDTLFQAIVQNDINQILYFINSGFDLNIKENLIDDNSLLHWAAIYSNEDVIKLLIDNGAHVNSLNKNGCTPLHELLQKRKDLRIIELFLKAKADWNIKASDGKFKDKSVLDICSNDPELCALMAEYSNEAVSEPQSPINSPQIMRLDSNLAKNDSINLSKWFENDKFNANDSTKMDLIDFLWPRPQTITFNDKSNEKFIIPDIYNPTLVYIKPPHTYISTESFKNLARAYSLNQFEFICKKKESTQIVMSIDENIFHIENSYTININKSLIEIVGSSIIACQYAFSTLLQLFKIYANLGIPLLKVSSLN
jgi:ankyrin repeat protein